MTNKSLDNQGGDIWGFAYGSLMWRPNFKYEKKVSRAFKQIPPRALYLFSLILGHR